MASLGPSQAKEELVKEARFVIKNDILNTDIQPFTATINSFGNGSKLTNGSGFEPMIFRNQFLVTEDRENEIVAPNYIISGFDSWKTGAFDGAEVDVFRISKGRFQNIRRDRIAAGGFIASGWIELDSKKALDPSSTSYEFAWDSWNRSEAYYYFTVRAIDFNGRESAPADFVSVVKPSNIGKTITSNKLIPLKSSNELAADLPAPDNLNASLTSRGTLELSWNPVPNAAGYKIYRSDTPPSKHLGYYLRLAGQGPPIKTGDLVILRATFLRTDRDKIFTNRVWNARVPAKPFSLPIVSPFSDDVGGGDWHLVLHDSNTPVQSPGSTYFRATLGPNDQLEIGRYNYSGLDQSFYDVLRLGTRYRVEAWIRGQAHHPIEFTVEGYYSDKKIPRIAPISFPVTPEWKLYSATFSVPEVYEGSKPGIMALHLVGPGQFDIDNFRIFEDESPFLAFSPTELDTLTASKMSALRTHAFIKTGTSTYDLNQLTNPAGATNILGGNTIPQTLTAMESAEIDPWLQIEPHLSREEWLGLVEYLAAPFDPVHDSSIQLPWAYKRYKQGHQEPWVDSFKLIRFEIGNETWNRLFRPWVFQEMRDTETGKKYSRGEVYGLYQEYVISIMRDSPYWERLADRLVPIIGGRSGDKYGFDAASVSPHTNLITHAAYIGGVDENEGPVEPNSAGYSSVLTHVLQTAIPRASSQAEMAHAIERKRGVPLEIGTYEGGPGYRLNGLNNEKVTAEEATQQEEVMKSVAAGTATLDAFLAYAQQGSTLQNYFTFGSGVRWASHARWSEGGQTYPAWDWLALFNKIALGDMLEVETLLAPTIDLPKQRRREAVNNGPLVAVYATKSSKRLTLIVISRRVPNFPDESDNGQTRVHVTLPIFDAQRITLYHPTGSYASSNARSLETSIVEKQVTATSGLQEFEIPVLEPGEAQIYVFDEVTWENN